MLDSGAQYIDGTTDITRTVHFGEPSLRQKECFTRVLQVFKLVIMLVDILAMFSFAASDIFLPDGNNKILLWQGHIALDQAVFPERTPGFVLDVLARSSLWKIGLDYRHGSIFLTT